MKRNPNIIYFDRKTKRFKKGGRFVSHKSGLKSKHGREQYYKRYPSRKPKKKPVIARKKKQILPEGYEEFDIYEEGLADFDKSKQLKTSRKVFGDRYWINQFDDIDIDDDDNYMSVKG